MEGDKIGGTPIIWVFSVNLIKIKGVPLTNAGILLHQIEITLYFPAPSHFLGLPAPSTAVTTEGQIKARNHADLRQDPHR